MNKGLDTYQWLVGIDEVGRGPIAGPVTIGCFAVRVFQLSKVKKDLKGIKESKQLSEQAREEWYVKLSTLPQSQVRWNTSSVSASVIDRDGIAVCIRRALKRSLKKLDLKPGVCLVRLDGGLKAPDEYAQETIIKGDEKEDVIAAASILAKITRDSYMLRQAQKFSGYGWESNKGYGSKGHRDAIQQLGLTPLHRSTWIR